MTGQALLPSRTTWAPSQPVPCQQAPDLWFPEDGPSGGLARKWCAKCPEAEACLSWAKTIRPSHGIWAGLSADQIGRRK